MITPLTRKWAESPWDPSPAFGETIPWFADRSTLSSSYDPGTSDDPGSGHAVCVHLRVEVGASAQERTMVEVRTLRGNKTFDSNRSRRRRPNIVQLRNLPRR